MLCGPLHLHIIYILKIFSSSIACHSYRNMTNAEKHPSVTHPEVLEKVPGFVELPKQIFQAAN